MNDTRVEGMVQVAANAIHLEPSSQAVNKQELVGAIQLKGHRKLAPLVYTPLVIH
jgi:hypothetical protein